MSDLLLFVIVLVVFYGVTGGRRFGHLSVISLFIYAQTTMAIGTLPTLDPDSQADNVHASVIMWSLGVLVFVAAIYSFVGLRTTRKNYSPDVDFTYPQGRVWTLIVISVAVSVVYYISVGYLAFFESLQSLVANSGEDLAGLRLSSYAGTQYFYPGYVNQFKNSLLPALTLVVIVSAYHFTRRGRAIMAILLVGTTLVFVLGTGQRGAFVIAIVVSVLFAYLAAPKRFHRYVGRIAIIGIVLFFIATFAGGRVAQQLAEAPDLGSQIGILFDQLAFRILGSNQTSSVAGFRYIYDNPISTGSEWAKALVGLLPGQRGSDISNQIFAVLYKSTRGTAPLSLWGSVYYNFGLFGVVLIALLLALILCKLAAMVNSTKTTNLLQIAGMAGVTATVGSWIADGPTSILNTGVVVYAFLWVWGRLRARAIENQPSIQNQVMPPTLLGPQPRARF